jgi:hypothetical protein
MMRSITPIPMTGTKEGVHRLREKSIGTGHDAKKRVQWCSVGSEDMGYDAALLLGNRGLPP